MYLRQRTQCQHAVITLFSTNLYSTIDSSTIILCISPN